MTVTSLGIAPALLLAQQAHIIDLDGPLHLVVDRGAGLRYDGNTIHPPDPKLWADLVDRRRNRSAMAARQAISLLFSFNWWGKKPDRSELPTQKSYH